MNKDEFEASVAHIANGRGKSQHVAACVAYIDSICGDAEAAHSAEDDLFRAILTGQAKHGNKMAREAIKSLDIEFGRWCA